MPLPMLLVRGHLQWRVQLIPLLTSGLGSILDLNLSLRIYNIVFKGAFWNGADTLIAPI